MAALDAGQPSSRRDAHSRTTYGRRHRSWRRIRSVALCHLRCGLSCRMTSSRRGRSVQV